MTADLTWTYRDLTFGHGQTWRVRSFDGLQGTDQRVGDLLLPRADGAAPGIHLANPRQVAFTLVTNGTVEQVEAAWDELMQGFRRERLPNDLTLTWKRPGQPDRFVYARPMQCIRSDQLEHRGTVAYATVLLVCADPRIYGTGHTVTVPLYDPAGGGTDFPVVEWPVNWDESGTGERDAVNNGNADAYPRIIVSGPTSGGNLTSATVTNTTNGDVVQIVTAVAPGQTLVADMGAVVRQTGDRPVELSGSSRYGDWVAPRTPLRLSPGSNVLRFEAGGNTAGVVCTVTYHDTSL